MHVWKLIANYQQKEKQSGLCVDQLRTQSEETVSISVNWSIIKAPGLERSIKMFVGYVWPPRARSNRFKRAHLAGPVSEKRLVHWTLERYCTCEMFPGTTEGCLQILPVRQDLTRFQSFRRVERRKFKFMSSYKINCYSITHSSGSCRATTVAMLLLRPRWPLVLD